MFPWRRRNDGFEWREYVRTTILLRRNDRRRRMEDAREAAVDAIRDAGRNGVSAAGFGLKATGRGLKSTALWLAEIPARLLASALPVIGPIASRAFSAVLTVLSAAAKPLEPLFSVLSRPALRLFIGVFGLIAATGAIVRSRVHGLDSEVGLSLWIAGAAAVLTLVPALARGELSGVASRLSAALAALGELLPRISDAWHPRRLIGATLSLAAVALAAGSLIWLVSSGAVTTGPLPVFETASPATVVEGRAVAASGDRLRVSGSALKLAGIEAPEPGQSCEKKSGSRWRCGETAKNALDRLVRGRRVSCKLVSGHGGEMRPAECSVQGVDLAAALIQQGHVFAAEDASTRLKALEIEARTTKLGVWAGEAERPEAFRAKRWEEAKRAAPEGCPIKGQVSGRERTYVLPWSPTYDRVKIRETRGERWFCSEEEARAAGWRATERS